MTSCLGNLGFLENQNPYAMWAQYGLLCTRDDETRDLDLVQLGISVTYFLSLHDRQKNPTLEMYGKIQSVQNLQTLVRSEFLKSALYKSVLAYSNSLRGTVRPPEIFTEDIRSNLDYSTLEANIVCKLAAKAFPQLYDIALGSVEVYSTPKRLEKTELEITFPEAPRKKFSVPQRYRPILETEVNRMQANFNTRMLNA